MQSPKKNYSLSPQGIYFRDESIFKGFILLENDKIS